MENEYIIERLEERRDRRNSATGYIVVHSKALKEDSVLFLCDQIKEHYVTGVARQCFWLGKVKNIWNLTTDPINAIAKHMETLSAKGANPTQSGPHLFHFSAELLMELVDFKHANYLSNESED